MVNINWCGQTIEINTTMKMKIDYYVENYCDNKIGKC